MRSKLTSKFNRAYKQTNDKTSMLRYILNEWVEAIEVPVLNFNLVDWNYGLKWTVNGMNNFQHYYNIMNQRALYNSVIIHCPRNRALLVFRDVVKENTCWDQKMVMVPWGRGWVIPVTARPHNVPKKLLKWAPEVYNIYIQLMYIYLQLLQLEGMKSVKNDRPMSKVS